MLFKAYIQWSRKTCPYVKVKYEIKCQNNQVHVHLNYVYGTNKYMGIYGYIMYKYK